MFMFEWIKLWASFTFYSSPKPSPSSYSFSLITERTNVTPTSLQLRIKLNANITNNYFSYLIIPLSNWTNYVYTRICWLLINMEMLLCIVRAECPLIVRLCWSGRVINANTIHTTIMERNFQIPFNKLSWVLVGRLNPDFGPLSFSQ